MAKKIKRIFIVYMDNAETWEDWNYGVVAVFHSYLDACGFLYGANFRMTDRKRHGDHAIGKSWSSLEPDEYSGNNASAWIEEWEVQ